MRQVCECSASYPLERVSKNRPGAAHRQTQPCRPARRVASFLLGVTPDSARTETARTFPCSSRFRVLNVAGKMGAIIRQYKYNSKKG
jgi:hypothetical protein